MKTFTVIVYSDAGHAWGKVKREVLRNLGIDRKISSYSYQRNDYAYLEEDCDLYLLQQAMDEDNVRLKYIERRTDGRSKIRSYDRYAP
jgi:hypothetical protein